jgi:CheY-like chemotaxis protein
MIPRFDNPDPGDPAQPSNGEPGGCCRWLHADTERTESPPPGDGSRLNLLISYTGWREESAVNQLPRLLEPMGIRSIRATSGEEAAEIIGSTRVHIAVVDLAMPLHRNREGAPAGSRILSLLRRLEQPPPTVVVRPSTPASRDSVRTLTDALREGAFAVLDRPVELETMLEVMRRVLRRHYADHWPET